MAPAGIGVPRSTDGQGLTLAAVEPGRENRAAVVVSGPAKIGAGCRNGLRKDPGGWRIAEYEHLKL